MTFGERLTRLVFVLAALIAPALAGYSLYFQWTTPIFDFWLVNGSNIVRDVFPGGQAEAAGLQAGDVLLAIDGIPFQQWRTPHFGSPHQFEVERGGQSLNLQVFAVRISQALPPRWLGLVTVMIFWGLGAVLLWRRYRQHEIRLLFLLSQAMAVTLLTPLAHAELAAAPFLVYAGSVACFFLAAPLFLHYALIFPARLGSPGLRRWGLALLYGLGAAGFAVWLSGSPLWRLSVLYMVLVMAAAIVAMLYAYQRCATPDGRRRLRVVLAGTLLAGVPPLIFYVTPIVLDSPWQMPEWLVGCFVLIAPLSYLYAVTRQNLFGIDRLFNRGLVYALLSLGIFAVYLGPVVLLSRWLPGDWLLQAITVAGLTLLIGWNFDWLRTRMQRGVDRLFYGGWYDYPGVVETISDALARCLERRQVNDALTVLAPRLMQLEAGKLIFDSSDTQKQEKDVAPVLQFDFTLQGGQTARWLAAAHRDGEDFTTSDRRILRTLARQAEVALNNVLLVEALRRQLDDIRASRESLTLVQRQLLRSREDERARLARDLHDGPIQTLVGLNMQLGMMMNFPATPPSPLTPLPKGEGLGVRAFRESLEAMRTEVRGLLGELRQVCAELRPPMLDTLGLGAAIRALADEWSGQHAVAVQISLPPDASLRLLPGEAAVNLYRVAQEALSNIARHAHATQAAIELQWDSTRLTLSVRDNGCGFDAEMALQAEALGHFGLAGMRERVELIGGEWTLISAPGRGAEVRVTWPKTI